MTNTNPPKDDPKTPPDDQAPGVSRRSMLDVALTAAKGGVGALLLVPAVRFATPPEIPGLGTPRVLAGRRDEFPENAARIVMLERDPVLVVALPGGEIRAFGARCSHLGCVVEYRASTERIECPCHRGRYGLDGRVLGGPPPSPLRAYPIEIRGNGVYVVRT